MQNDFLKKRLLQLLGKSRQHEYACILISNEFADEHGSYEILAGFGATRIIHQLDELDKDNLKFGFFSYDLKNKIEKLRSENPASISVPEMFFFEPQFWYKLNRDKDEECNFDISQEGPPEKGFDEFISASLQWESPSKEKYLNTIDRIRNDIQEGTYYELNYCSEWKGKNAQGFDPYSTFYRLNEASPAPFAAFFRLGDKYLLCSSPERFLHAAGDRIISQPIKGTRRRQKDAHQDSLVKTELMTSEKDRAENVMITDLVRNDLSRFCVPGTVEVDELCGIHSFSHVHQMISTVSGKMEGDTSIEKIIRSAFPMGSMTGAPKIKVMECAEELEDFKRGWYSGSVGYMEQNKMDLNVVIRSLQYDAAKQILSYHAGGAITFDSIAELEFQECMDKAAGIMGLFTGDQLRSNL